MEKGRGVDVHIERYPNSVVECAIYMTEATTMERVKKERVSPEQRL